MWRGALQYPSHSIQVVSDGNTHVKCLKRHHYLCKCNNFPWPINKDEACTVKPTCTGLLLHHNSPLCSFCFCCYLQLFNPHPLLFWHHPCPVSVILHLHPLFPHLWPSPLSVPPSHLGPGPLLPSEPLCPHYRLLLFDSLPGRMTSGKPSLRVSARALLNTAWFSRLICSSSPRSSCREMMRPGGRRGEGWAYVCKIGGKGQMKRCQVVGGKWDRRKVRDAEEGRDIGVFKGR